MKTMWKIALLAASLTSAAPAYAQAVIDSNTGQNTENAAAANANGTASVRHRHRARVSSDNNSSIEANKSGGTAGALKDDTATGTSPAAHH